MKSILTDQSSGAFVPWSHISKVIAAMEIMTREFRINDDEMNEIMLGQCIHLLRESPYTLKLNKLGAGNPEAEAKGAAHSTISMSLREMDAHSYGKATLEVTNWISKMVNLHLELPINLNDLPDTDEEKDDDEVDYDEIYQEEAGELYMERAYHRHRRKTGTPGREETVFKPGEFTAMG